MPSLRKLECKVEWANTDTAFQEYGTAYGDGVVETYIVIPNSAQSFTIRVTSKAYIYEGLALLVFMDGEYQCNRNRMNLKPRRKGLPRSSTEIDIRLRQKEKPVQDGTFIGREWRFDNHNIVREIPLGTQTEHFEELGTIQILVLRCRMAAHDENGSTSSSGADSDPLGNTPDIDDVDSVFEDIPHAQETLVSASRHGALAAEEAPMDGLLGIFDGGNDQPDKPQVGQHGVTHGYWAYHPYPQNHSTYNAVDQPGTRPSYNTGPIATNFSPRNHSQQSLHHDTGPEKHVHFDMGGAPNTQPGLRPRREQWPNGPVPWPPVVPPIFDPSIHGAGQHTGYHAPQVPIPFLAIPPLPRYQVEPRQISDPGWCGGSYMPHGIYQGYGYGSGYGHYPYGSYSQIPGYGLGQPVQGSTGSQQGKAMDEASSSGLTREENQHTDEWGSKNNNGNTPGNASGGDGWGFTDNTNESASGGDGANNNTVNNSGAVYTWNEEKQHGDANENGGTWGETVEVTTPQTDRNGWDDSNKNNSNKSGGQDDQWGNNPSGNQNQDQNQQSTYGTNILNNNQNNKEAASNSWSQQEAAHNANEFQQQIPGAYSPTFSPSQPRALYGPHGPYYMMQPMTVGEVKPEVEEEPRYDVPLSHVEITGSTHQVQPGRGYLYMHKRRAPEYIDSIEEPYARFVFKYRTKQQLAQEIGVQVDVEPRSDPEVQELAGKSKEEIIDLYLRAKSACGGQVPEPPERTAEKLDQGLKPVSVPVPERRVKGYTIPVRSVNSAKPAGLGIGNMNALTSSIPGWKTTPPQQQDGNWSKSGNNSNNAANTGPQWDSRAPNQNQDQNQSANAWDQGSGNDGFGGAGSRPVSPQCNSGNEWGQSTNVKSAGGGGQSGW